MAEPPLVTVAIATYNRAELLSGAIDSALSQTYPNIEVVIVNDGSEDDTPAVLAPYEDDSRFVIVHHQENKGVGGAKDRTVTEASGDFIAFLDDDDRWEPSKLSRQVDRLRDSDYSLVYTGATFESSKDTHQNNELATGDLFPEILINNHVVPFSSVMAKTEMVREVGGFDPEFPRAVDWDLWIRLTQKGPVDAIEKPLTVRRKQPDSITADQEHFDQSRTLVWEKYQDIFQEYPEIRSRYLDKWYRVTALQSARSGKRIKAIRKFWPILSSHPSPKNIALAMGLLGGPKVLDKLPS